MPPPPAHRVPSSAIASFIDRGRIDRLLEPWVPQATDRAFVLRCLLDEGPVHHRGANYVLLALLGELAAVAPTAAPSVDDRPVPIPMRLPPHHGPAGEDGAFPLQLPTRALERLCPTGSTAFEAMVDCLTDGPPQHALGNAAMVCLLTALLGRPEPPPA